MGIGIPVDVIELSDSQLKKPLVLGPGKLHSVNKGAGMENPKDFRFLYRSNLVYLRN